MRRGLAIGLIAAAFACGCGEKEPGMTPEQMVSVLREAGIRYNVCESAALSSVSAPGVRMRGESLAVEIYQIDDPSRLDDVRNLAQQVSASQASATGGYSMQSYVRGNLLILVRDEPERGMIAAALPPPRE